jgi:hypothetical protein
MRGEGDLSAAAPPGNEVWTSWHPRNPGEVKTGFLEDAGDVIHRDMLPTGGGVDADQLSRQRNGRRLYHASW